MAELLLRGINGRKENMAAFVDANVVLGLAVMFFCFCFFLHFRKWYYGVLEVCVSEKE